VDLGIAKEEHEKPAHPAYKYHFHFVLKASHQLDNVYTAFDPTGASGFKLKVHITFPDDDNHWGNQVRYLLKQGQCVFAMSDTEPFTKIERPKAKKAKVGVGWAECLKAACSEPGITPMEAVDKVKDEHFGDWVMHYDKMLAAATRIVGLHQPAV
jgi:hypothetical protein